MKRPPRRSFPDPGKEPAHAERVAADLAETIDKLAALHGAGEERVGRHQQAVEHVTHQLGQPRSLYLILAFVLGWIALNLAAPRMGLVPLDPPPFYFLQGFVSLTALLMTAMILTTQNRQGRHARHRAMLDLEINLLAERKAAKIIALLEELRRDLPNVQNRTDPIAEAMTAAVDPIGKLSEGLEAPPQQTPAPGNAPDLKP